MAIPDMEKFGNLLDHKVFNLFVIYSLGGTNVYGSTTMELAGSGSV